MSSLKAVYQSIVEQDQVKLAQAYEADANVTEADEGLLKQAQDYDHIGRILAHNVFGDMLKTAMEDAMPEASDEDKAKALAALLAKANGEKGEDEDEGEGEEEEKKASVKAAILQRMAQDPEYVSALVGKYYGR